MHAEREFEAQARCRRVGCVGHGGDGKGDGEDDREL